MVGDASGGVSTNTASYGGASANTQLQPSRPPYSHIRVRTTTASDAAN